ncbi:MAG: GyrI-like domain-containing protein [candidate division WOR-3 bacterium]|mgnify:CR=1 FL=1|nr:GyrI-like domain-containing protein [candidate division WOR-3 bacterium]
MEGKVKSLIIFVVILLLFGCGSRKEKVTSDGFSADVESLVVVNKVAVMERTGPYKNIGGAIAELMSRLQQYNVSVAGKPFAIYYNDPTEVPPESLSWAVCVPLNTNANVDSGSGIKTVNLPRSLFAYTIHSGGYAGIAQKYDQLEDWIEEHGLMITGPALEFWLSDGDVPTESMRIKLGFIVAAAPDSIIEEEETEELEYQDEDDTTAETIPGR